MIVDWSILKVILWILHRTDQGQLVEGRSQGPGWARYWLGPGTFSIRQIITKVKKKSPDLILDDSQTSLEWANKEWETD